MNTTTTDIAIIGMACRFPDANNYEEYWQLLQQARSCIREVPPERWDWRKHWGDPSSGKSISKWGGFVKDANCFDAAFFNHSGKEAESMDPQQRLMLQLSWDCLEDAGIPPSQLSGSNTGVYIGVFNADYKELEEKAGFIEAHYGTGTATAVIPNRISYCYNFNGPSVPVDTACSSSLHAIHLAAQSIQLGECDLALAGGVNLLFTPSRYIAFSKAGMLSPTGSCKTFDEKADGYVRSEGAALVVLKSLRKALEDGDTIHGILKGSAVNHGGKAHTLTYPKPETQAAVIMAAMKRAGLKPETINYVEAHGTGTPKGDPIEFQGLVKAFTAHLAAGSPTPTGYCALGSAKSNIGHLEAAAGIAGLIKVLLAMKYKQLPALVNFQQLNHRISLQGTPFYILDQLQEWRRLVTADGNELPRRAGVSSFGFGGTNAHVILEEPPVIHQPAPAAWPAYLVCLSAKTATALQQKIQDLSAWLDEQPEDLHLANLSYTLLLGREHFDLRIAFVVPNLTALKTALRSATVQGLEKQPALSAPEAASCDEIMKTLYQERTVNPEAYTEKIRSLAGWYERGYKGDWSLLFGEAAFKRLALPAYPFAKIPYWIPGNKTISASPLQALPQETNADATGQRFTVTFTGEEHFLRDHVIKDRRILPGVAYLEMVRAAAQRTAIQIRNIVWSAPFIMENTPQALHLSFRTSAAGNTAYEVYSEDAQAKKILHSQGSISTEAPENAPAHNLAALQQRCNQHTFSQEAWYAALRKGGFNYGPSHQAVEQVYIGADEVLAKLSLPVDNTYVLHPGLMDAGLQLSMAWLAKEAEHSGQLKTLLPFALGELIVYSPCTAAMYAIARYSAGSGPHAPVQKLDIDLCDTNGKVCVRMNGFSARLSEKETPRINISAPADVVQLRACWRERPAPENTGAVYDGHVVILCEASLSALSFISNTIRNVQCFSLAPAAGPLEEQFAAYSWQLLEIIQRIVKERPTGKLLLQVLAPDDGQGRLLAALKGGLATAALEYQRLSVQLIEHTAALSTVTDILQQNMQAPDDRHIRYENGKRLVKEWEEMDNTVTATLPWKEGGVYLVTGGTGGLGQIFAQEIVHRNRNLTLILTGRSPLTAEKEAQLQQLQHAGANVIYRQTDISDKAAVQRLFRWIKEACGRLNGILHCAGLLRDNFIARKTEEELRAVLAPKVAGLLYLDEASRDMPLDFMALFSSFVAVLGNAGQADYALANAFMDEYAHYRNSLVQQGLRNGTTLSLNWPLWKEGGMQVNETVEKNMWIYAGVKPMATDTGINAFYTALHGKAGQLIVVQGDTGKVKKKLLRDTAITAVPQQQAAPPAADLLPQLLQYAAEILKIDANNLDGDTGLEEYGFDSILYTAFTNRLNEAYGLELTPTIFFEHPNLAALAACLQPQTTTARPAPAVKAEEPQLTAPLSQLPANTGDDTLTEQLTTLLISYAAEILKIPAQHLDPATGIDEYGFDSILYTEFTNRLNEAFKLELAPTIFFEHASLQALALFLTNSHHAALTTALPPAAAPIQPPAPEPVAPQPAVSVKTTADNTATGPDPIAIIGMSGKFPMAEDPHDLWKNLLAGKDCISEIPADRWDWKACYGNATTEPGKTRIKWGGFMDNATAFDPAFFRISPAEAAYMDPHQRLLMMYVWKAIEDAGYAPQNLAGSNTALFVGMSNHDFSGLISQTGVQVEGYTSTGVISCVGPNRMSYFLDLHGPSEPVETACSSSLVAIHRAVRAIRSGDCDLAIAGGVQALLSPQLFISFNKAGMLSEDGRCKTFSGEANGYVRGEGVGMILLKRLADAEKDGDHIYGVIRATAENHGGRANSLTAPNVHAQAALLKAAYTQAGIDPRTVTYIEAHGTGTKLGDPIEVNALKTAFQELYAASGDTTVNGAHCGVGSIKTNIGHLEYAAGIAGVIKVLLQLQHRTLAKSLHSASINPYIQLDGSPFFIVQQTQEWKAIRDANGRELPRRAGVSSFGFGGVNAHIVIEEYIPAPAAYRCSINEDQPGIFILSAKNEERLRQQARQLLTMLETHACDSNALTSIAYTLQTGRNAMEERLGIIAASQEALLAKLRAFMAGEAHTSGLYHGRAKKQAPAPPATGSDVQQLLASWIEGYPVNWRQLYGNATPRRMSLPSYPFAKERHWLTEEVTTPLVTMPAPAPMQEQSAPAPAPAAAPTPASPDSILRMLVQQVSGLLKIKEEKITRNTNLHDYGFDSLLFTQFSNQLNEQLGLELTPTIFFEHPSLEELALHLQSAYGDVLAAKFPTQAAPAPHTPAAPLPPEPERKNGLQPIAIIGMSAELPMAKNIQEFWDNLLAEKDCISEIPADRWDWRAYSGAATRWGGFIDGMSAFDPLFFNISPAEAMYMEPSHRLLMTHVWKAIEDAGYAPHSLSGSNTGIFSGIMCYEYNRLLLEAGFPAEGHSSTGMVGCMATNRMSYFLNLHGPSEPIETACSSSLVAIHRAVEAIRSGACDMAIAGGVNTLLAPEMYENVEKAGMISRDGRSKTFSDKANGYARGEGAGMLLLKRLEDAERDGDHIYGVIRSTAENHGGRATSLTAPNPKAQVQLLLTAYRKAGIDPRTVTYIEAHGTGTPLGDPIETAALKTAFNELYQSAGITPAGPAHCGLGSVKTNIGHLEVAAGVAGVIKVLLQLQHKTLIKSLHSETINPYIQLDGSPFYIVQQTRPWEAIRDAAGKQLPRRAGISSFGFGGVNAHVVIEEYIPPVQPAHSSHPPHAVLIILSARNKERLDAYARSLLAAFEKMPQETSLERIAYTLQTGREHMEERIAFVVSSMPALCATLRSYCSENDTAGIIYGSVQLHKIPESNEQDIAQLDAWIADGRLEQVAAQWVKGYTVDWQRLYGAEQPQRMPLPGYSFAPNRYWVTAKRAKTASLPATHTRQEERALLNGHIAAEMTDERLLEKGTACLKGILQELLMIPADEIAADVPFEQYGVDSMIITRFMSRLRQVYKNLENNVLAEYPTISELLEHLVEKDRDALIRLLSPEAQSPVAAQPRFAELIHLNNVNEGRPVFWMHPIGGGIESYQAIAAASKRPFYGIAAGSWTNDPGRINGIPELAACYIRMVRSLQPAGPYDLGGYSLGGALAYEMARQLQETGEVVKSIVMLDAIYVPGMMDRFRLSYKSMILQTVNLSLLARETNGTAPALIHRDEVPLDAPDNDFLQQLTTLARARGLQKTAAQLDALAQTGMAIQRSGRFTDYKVLPLTDPEGLTCYYFRNSSRSFYGELAPYCITAASEELPIENVPYWDAWERLLPHFKMADLHTASHITLMNDPVVLQQVLALCETLYAPPAFTLLNAPVKNS